MKFCSFTSANSEIIINSNRTIVEIIYFPRISHLSNKNKKKSSKNLEIRRSNKNRFFYYRLDRCFIYRFKSMKIDRAILKNGRHYRFEGSRSRSRSNVPNCLLVSDAKEKIIIDIAYSMPGSTYIKYCTRVRVKACLKMASNRADSGSRCSARFRRRRSRPVCRRVRNVGVFFFRLWQELRFYRSTTAFRGACIPPISSSKGLPPMPNKGGR